MNLSEELILEQQNTDPKSFASRKRTFHFLKKRWTRSSIESVERSNTNTRSNLTNSWQIKEWKMSSRRYYLILMHLYRTSANLLYMWRFKYILSTFFLPLFPICSLADGFLSKNLIFSERIWVPRCPTGWSRPVTFCSTISLVPPASVPSTCHGRRKKNVGICLLCFWIYAASQNTWTILDWLIQSEDSQAPCHLLTSLDNLNFRQALEPHDLVWETEYED